MILLLHLLSVLLSECSGYVDFPSSCIGEENGYQWIKPLEGDDFPPIYQKCDKEYMIIDLNLDDNVQTYFSSMDKWHSAISGPAREDPANWESWWLPNARFLEEYGIITLPEEDSTDDDMDSADDANSAKDEYDWSLPEGFEQQKETEEEDQEQHIRGDDYSGDSEEDALNQEEPQNEETQNEEAQNEKTSDHERGQHKDAEDETVDTVSEGDESMTSEEGSHDDIHQDFTRYHDNSGSAETANRRRLSTKHKSLSQYFRYVLSPDCSSCEATIFDTVKNAQSALNDDVYGDRSAYYMTGPMFDCGAESEVMADCTMDEDTYHCPVCTAEGANGDLGYSKTAFPELYSRESVSLGMCGLTPMSSYSDKVPQTQNECVGGGGALKPSIGDDGRFCVCYKPQSDYDTATRWRAPPSLLEQYKEEWEQKQEAKLLAETEEEDTGSIDDIYELHQSDFVKGTYRITRSGTYRIMEDILFDFQSGNVRNPNAANAWFPKKVQQKTYPGAGGTRDEYHQGFFAGITVEADDVVIDLNDHQLAQSEAFYHQQRFFSVIALKSVVFPIGQSLNMGHFGTEPKYANNVVIKDGSIGLSSHHGIHGQSNDQVTIENVHIHSFETHGVQMSDFKNLKMNNVEIGPSSTMAFLKAEYGFARWTLQRLLRIANDEEGEINREAFPLSFEGRDEELTLDAVILRLKTSMDMAFKWVMGIEKYSDDDEQFIASKSLFINEDGIPSGGSMYGLFLNQRVPAIYGNHPSLKHSFGAEISALSVHDLKHKMVEYLRLDRFQESTLRNPVGGALSADAVLGHINGQIDWTEARYKGDVLLDAFVALEAATSDSSALWGERGAMTLGQEFVDWTQGLHQWSNDDDEGHPHLGCNNDAMGMLPRGVIGVRMDGVENVGFRGLDIFNLYESSESGSDFCGEYWNEDFSKMVGGGHPFQSAPYLYGYSGNMAHGVMSDWSTFSLEKEVNVHHIYSKTGLVRAIGLYTKSEVIYFKDDPLPTMEPTVSPTTSKPTTSKPTTSYPTTSKPTTSQPTEEVKHVRGQDWDEMEATADGIYFDETEMEFEDGEDIFNEMQTTPDGLPPPPQNPNPPNPPLTPPPVTGPSATLNAFCNNDGRAYLSRSGGTTWTVMASNDIENVDENTVIRYRCTAMDETGWFLATMKVEEESYSTTEPLEDGYWSLVMSSDDDLDLIYLEANVEGVADDAVWVWNQNIDNTMVFEFDFGQITFEEPEDEVIDVEDENEEDTVDEMKETGTQNEEDGVDEMKVTSFEEEEEETNAVGESQGHWDPANADPSDQNPDIAESVVINAESKTPEPSAVDEGAVEWLSDSFEDGKKHHLRDRRMKRRSRSKSKSKLLRPFKELKRFDPFSRRLMDGEEGEDEIDALWIESWTKSHGDHSAKRSLHRMNRDLILPQMEADDATIYGIPDYAESGYQGVDLNALRMDELESLSLLKMEENDKMPYDKYGLSAPGTTKKEKPKLDESAKPIPPKPDDLKKVDAPKPGDSKPEDKAPPKSKADDKPKDVKPAPVDGPKLDDKPPAKPDQGAPQKAVPQKPEEGAPEKPAPKEAEGDDAEVEWPDVPGESSTKYGLPDYSNGFEGEDAASIPDAPTLDESADDDDGDDEASRHSTSINIYYLVAGQSLFEHDTVSKASPHAPAVAKPFHIVDDFLCDDGHQCGVRTLFEPETLRMWCVFGKDGEENDYNLDDSRIDNAGCFAHDLFYDFQTMTFSSSTSSSYSYSAPLIWSLAMIGFGILATIVFFLCRLYLRRRHYKDTIAAPNDCEGEPLTDHDAVRHDLETEQLTATIHDRYDGSMSMNRSGGGSE